MIPVYILDIASDICPAVGVEFEAGLEALYSAGDSVERVLFKAAIAWIKGGPLKVNLHRPSRWQIGFWLICLPFGELLGNF